MEVFEQKGKGMYGKGYASTLYYEVAGDGKSKGKSKGSQGKSKGSKGKSKGSRGKSKGSGDGPKGSKDA